MLSSDYHTVKHRLADRRMNNSTSLQSGHAQTTITRETELRSLTFDKQHNVRHGLLNADYHLGQEAQSVRFH